MDLSFNFFIVSNRNIRVQIYRVSFGWAFYCLIPKKSQYLLNS